MTGYQQYQIGQSRLLLFFVLSLHAAFLLAVIFTINAVWLVLALTMLSLLLVYLEFDKYQLKSSPRTLTMTLKSADLLISINNGVETQCFPHIKLFSNRWFLILQLRNEQQALNLVLVPDRFESLSHYLEFRYQAGKMTTKIDAC